MFKIYAESFKDQAHLDLIASEAHAIVSEALRGGAIMNSNIIWNRAFARESC